MDVLVPIGRFSRMTRLSIKALRLYDEQGLLSPSAVDSTTGYRYYSRSQVNRAEAIRILRIVDMPLEEIRELLAEDDPDFTSKRLAMHRERLAERLADQERMLRFLQRLIDQGGGIMPYDVTIKQVPAQLVASLTVHTSVGKVGSDIPTGFGSVIGAMAAAGAPPIGAPFLIYHDVIDEQTNGDIEICIPVPPGQRPARDDVEWKEIPGGTVAAAIHRGPYDEVTPAYHAVTGWIHDHGHQITAAPREIYLNDPQTVSPDDLLTEVQFPIDAA